MINCVKSQTFVKVLPVWIEIKGVMENGGVDVCCGNGIVV